MSPLKPIIKYLLILISFSIFSCKKNGDIPIADCNYCRVEAVDVLPRTGNVEHFDFTYNNKGNPVRTTQSKTVIYKDDDPNNYIYHFRYDSQDRLTDFIETYPPGYSPDGTSDNIVYWYRYTYTNKWTVVDSINSYMHGGGIYSDSMKNPIQIPGNNGSYVAVLTLDNKGRIIKYVSGNALVNYVYNSQGNREGDTYDNKPNIYLSNKVWQFVFNDFSVNNPLTGLGLKINSYNIFGLPTKYKLIPPVEPGDDVDGFVLGFSTTSAVNITYSCGAYKTLESKL